MLTYFKNLWLDEKRFVGFIRGLAGALSAALMTDVINFAWLSETYQTVIALTGTFLAFFMRSNTDHVHPHPNEPVRK